MNRTKGISLQHAGVFADRDGFAEVGGEAVDDPFRERAQLPLRRVHDLNFVLGRSDAFQHRRLRARIADAHGGMNQLFRVFDDIERFPLGLEKSAIEAEQLRGDELAKRMQDRIGRLVQNSTGRTDDRQRFFVRLCPHRGLGLHRQLGFLEQEFPGLSPSFFQGELLQLKKDQSVHRTLMDCRRKFEFSGARLFGPPLERCC